jgi:tetratricopeptide (TPR) repeat protein
MPCLTYHAYNGIFALPPVHTLCQVWRSIMGRRTVVLFVLAFVVLGMHLGCSPPPEGSPDWYFNRAYDYADQGQYEKAVEEYTKVLENNPTNTVKIQTYVNRAAAYACLNRWEESISDATEAINLDPDNILAYMNRAMAYNAMEEYSLAIADFNQIIELDNTVAEAYVHRAYVYINIEEFNKAIDDCNTALDIDPEQTHAYFNRGLAYKGLGLIEEAIADFERFIILTDNTTWIEMATEEIESLLNQESVTEETSE